MMDPTEQSDDDIPANDSLRADEDRWVDWPCCPGCGRRRRTRCSTCDLGSDDFPLAEFIPAAESRPASGGNSSAPSEKNFDILLMCPGCDEAFWPEFYRLCEQCGHDFGDGLLIEPSGSDRTTDRVILVVAFLIAMGSAVLAYFWYLFAS